MSISVVIVAAIPAGVVDLYKVGSLTCFVYQLVSTYKFIMSIINTCLLIIIPLLALYIIWYLPTNLLCLYIVVLVIERKSFFTKDKCILYTC